MSENSTPPANNSNYPPTPSAYPPYSYPYNQPMPPMPPPNMPPYHHNNNYYGRGGFRGGYHGRRNNFRGNRGRRNQREFDHQERNDPIHTVFFHNIDYDTKKDEFIAYASQFGEISSVFTKFEKGIAFITYFDIRSAEKAVKSEYGKMNGREVQTSFAYRPPSHSKRNASDTCSTIQVKSMADLPKIDLDDVQEEMSKYGEIRESRPADEKASFIIKFYDLRSARDAVSHNGQDVKGETVTIDYMPEEDEGDDPEDHTISNGHHHRNSSMPYNYSQSMPPFDQMNYPYPVYSPQSFPPIPPMFPYPPGMPAPPPPPQQFNAPPPNQSQPPPLGQPPLGMNNPPESADQFQSYPEA